MKEWASLKLWNKTAMWAWCLWFFGTQSSATASFHSSFWLQCNQTKRSLLFLGYTGVLLLVAGTGDVWFKCFNILLAFHAEQNEINCLCLPFFSQSGWTSGNGTTPPQNFLILWPVVIGFGRASALCHVTFSLLAYKAVSAQGKESWFWA